MRKNNKTVIVACGLVLFVLLCGFMLLVYSRNTQKDSVDDPLAPKSTDHVLTTGPAHGYTVITYFSIDCPHCRELLLAETANIKKYQGVITILYRHFPLKSEPLSFDKAVIAECVYKQGGDAQFFAFMTDAYTHFDSKNATNEWFLKKAEKFATDKATLHTCIADTDTQESIRRLRLGAQLAKITYSPTLLIFHDGVFIKKVDGVNAAGALKAVDFYAQQPR